MTAEQESMLNDLLKVDFFIREMDTDYLGWLDVRRDKPLSSTQHEWLKDLTYRYL